MDDSPTGVSRHGVRASPHIQFMNGVKNSRISRVAGSVLRHIPILSRLTKASGASQGSASQRALLAAHRRAAVNSGLRNRHKEFLQEGELRVHVCTWNVGLQLPPADLKPWLNVGSESDIPDVVVVCLQETELSGPALMLEVTDAHVTWLEAITSTLHRLPGVAEKRLRFRKVEAVQLVGLVLLLLVRSDHLTEVKNVRKAITRTGALSMMGNKGAIGIRATIYGKRFLFICAHFAPHDSNVSKRNSNFRSSLAELTLDVGDLLDDEVDFCMPSRPAEANKRGGSGFKLRDRMLRRKKGNTSAVQSGHKLIKSHDYVFFAGDLNYRLANITKEEVLDKVTEEDYDGLLDHDQLRTGILEGHIFRGFLEAQIDFPPTYKYDIGTSNFDSSAKQRTPAYTDRVLFRYLDPDVRVVAPFAPTASKMSRVLNRVAIPFRERPRAIEKQPLSQRRSSLSVVELQRHTSAVEATRNLARVHSAPSTTTLDITKEISGPDEDEDEAFREAVRASSKQSVNNVDSGPCHDGSASNSSTLSEEEMDAMRGMPYILNHLVVENYCSVPTFTSSDHKPVAAAFRAAVVRRDATKADRVVFEVMQELDLDDLRSVAGDLDFLVDEAVEPLDFEEAA